MQHAAATRIGYIHVAVWTNCDAAWVVYRDVLRENAGEFAGRSEAGNDAGVPVKHECTAVCGDRYRSQLLEARGARRSGRGPEKLAIAIEFDQFFAIRVSHVHVAGLVDGYGNRPRATPRLELPHGYQRTSGGGR